MKVLCTEKYTKTVPNVSDIEQTKATMHVLNKILCTYLPPKTLPPENLCLKIRDQFPETSETGLDPPLLIDHSMWSPLTVTSNWLMYKFYFMLCDNYH